MLKVGFYSDEGVEKILTRVDELISILQKNQVAIRASKTFEEFEEARIKAQKEAEEFFRKHEGLQKE